MLRSTFVAEHFRSVTEIAWSQPFLCVNRIPGLFGMIFAAALKLYGNSVNILSVSDVARTTSSYIEVYYNNSKLLSFSSALFASKVNVIIQPERSSNHTYAFRKARKSCSRFHGTPSPLRKINVSSLILLKT